MSESLETSTTLSTALKFLDGSDSKVLEELNDQGKKIYQKNTSLRDIATVMEHPEFRSFVDRYFNNVADAQSALMLIKTYQKIEKCFPKLDPYQKISLLHKIIGNSNTRRQMTEDFINWRDTHNSKQHSDQLDDLQKRKKIEQYL